MDSYRLKVEQIIKNLSFFDGETKDQMFLNEDLGFDSLRMVRLIIALEEEFNIIIDETDLDPRNLVTFGDVVKLVKKYDLKKDKES